MHIYTATVATNKTVIPASFFQRNIEGFTAGPIHDTKVMGYPTQKVPTYEMYKGNIATFIAATASQTTLQIGPFHGLQYLEELVPFHLPPVVFGLNELIKLSPDPNELDLWFTKLVTVTLGKFDTSYTKLKSCYKITLNKPVWSSLDSIVAKLAMPAPVAEPRQLNIYYTQSYRHLHQVVSMFLRTHTYPCFQEEDDVMVDGEKLDTHWDQGVETVSTVNFNGQKLKAWAASQEDVMPNKKTTTWLYSKANIDLEDMEMTFNTSQLVPKAKPSPISLKVNWGAPSEVPAQGGLLFPYFPGMILQDKTSLFKLFTRHFVNTLDVSAAGIEERIGRLRRDFDNGSATALHLEFTHVFFMINLALETQSRLYLVFSDDYLGAVLLGAKFKIFTGVVWVGPEDSGELHKSLSKLAPHEVAVHTILDVISRNLVKDAPVITDGEVEAAIASSWELAELLRRTAVMKLGTEDWEKMQSGLATLSFRGGFKNISEVNVNWAMSEINQSGPFTTTFNVFLPNDARTLREVINTRLARVLAAFGSDTFSLFATRGVRYKLPVPFTAADKDGRIYEQSNGPAALFIFRKPLAVVLGEFEYLQDDTKESAVSVGSLAVERAVNQRKVFAVTEKGVIPIWNELVRFHYPKVDAPVFEKPKKRGADGQPEGEGSRAKRVEIDPNSIFDLSF